MRFLAMVLLVVTFLGCKQKSEGIDNSPCTKAGDCQSGFKCIMKKCVDEKLVQAVLKEAADRRCKQAFNCKAYGWCTSEKEQCIVASDSDCKQSDNCKWLGMCTSQKGMCIATTAVDCERSDGCTNIGQCTLVEGKCMVASDADCQRSKLCKRHSICKFHNGACVR